MSGDLIPVENSATGLLSATAKAFSTPTSSDFTGHHRRDLYLIRANTSRDLMEGDGDTFTDWGGGPVQTYAILHPLSQDDFHNCLVVHSSADKMLCVGPSSLRSVQVRLVHRYTVERAIQCLRDSDNNFSQTTSKRHAVIQSCRFHTSTS